MEEVKENKRGGSKLKKFLSITLNVLFICFFLLCLFALILSVTAKRSADGATEVFGHELRVVVSSSMEKCDQTDVSGYEIKDIPVNSLIFVQKVPEDDALAAEWYGRLKTGDVLTFRYVYTRQETITHRITGITSNEDGGYTIKLAGDNKSEDGDALEQTIDTADKASPNYVIGKVIGKSLFLGLLVTAIRSPWGLIFIIIVPCLIIIAGELIKIFGTISQKKRALAEKAQREKDQEIAELKRRLAEIGASADKTEGKQSDPPEEK